MLEITSLNRGIVIDHIKPGLGIKIFNLLHLDELEDEVALILNANSTSQGKKDIVKIANNLDINLDAVSIIDSSAIVNFIEDGEREKKIRMELPEVVEDVLTCKNPRCITNSEREIPGHKFFLYNRDKKEYKCEYCDTVTTYGEWYDKDNRKY